MVKSERQIINLSHVRQFLIDLSGKQKENSFIIWYSVQKGQFSCHYLGVQCASDRLSDCLEAAEDVAVKAYNKFQKDKAKDFADLLFKVEQGSEQMRARAKLAELQKEIDLLKEKYQL